jgi:general stress protein YciG
MGVEIPRYLLQMVDYDCEEFKEIGRRGVEGGRHLLQIVAFDCEASQEIGRKGGGGYLLQMAGIPEGFGDLVGGGRVLQSVIEPFASMQSQGSRHVNRAH